MKGSEREGAEEAIKQLLGYRFDDPALLEMALTHKSYANETPGVGEDNQRLEFLGDAVLGMVVAEALMERLPDAPEGELTPRRAALVNEQALAELAREIDLGSLMRLGRGEEMNKGRERSSILADAFEAVVGAVYLDSGFEAARSVVLSWLGSRLGDTAAGDLPGDAKTVLQEALQSRGVECPVYRVAGEEGPDHDKVFEVEILVGESVLARGTGRSKKEAEKTAARQALVEMEDSG